MIKKILFTIFILIYYFGYSQVAIGRSKTEIMQRYSADGIVSSVGKDGLNQATYQTEIMLVMYYFNEDDLCKETIICPLNSYGLKAYRDKFNKEYMEIDSNNWSFYVKGIKHFVSYEFIEPHGMFWIHL